MLQMSGLLWLQYLNTAQTCEHMFFPHYFQDTFENFQDWHLVLSQFLLISTFIWEKKNYCRNNLKSAFLILFHCSLILSTAIKNVY